jgi:hypothetical protein
MLDELREQASSSSFEEVSPKTQKRPYRERRFLGMTAFQRFFITVMLFFITCILGIFFLIVAQKIVPGFLIY